MSGTGPLWPPLRFSSTSDDGSAGPTEEYDWVWFACNIRPENTTITGRWHHCRL